MGLSGALGASLRGSRVLWLACAFDWTPRPEDAAAFRPPGSFGLSRAGSFLIQNWATY